MREGIVALGLLLISGCATATSVPAGHYEYDLVEPATYKQHIGNIKPVVLKDRGHDIRFALKSMHDHVVLWILNSTPNAVVLVGDESVIIDPQGKTHGTASQTMLHGAIARIVWPPLLPQDPRWVVEDPNGSNGDFSPYYYRRPGGAYYAYRDSATNGGNDPDDPNFFRWEGETDLYVKLCLQSGGEKWYRGLILHRRKLD